MSTTPLAPPTVFETFEKEYYGVSHETANIFGFQAIMRRLARKRSALFGLVIICLLVFVAAFAPWLAPHDRNLIYKRANLVPPVGWTKIPGSTRVDFAPEKPPFHLTQEEVDKELTPVAKKQYRSPYKATDGNYYFLLGTDKAGRDIMSRLIYGARISLIVGIAAELINILIGVAIGASAGFYGGRLDNLLMRFTDIFFAFPSLLLAISLLAALEHPGLWSIFVALGISGWTPIARIVRGQVLAVKENEFIQAARAQGASDFRLIMTHIMPNSLAPIIVVSTLGVAGNILGEAGLSFLGLGIQPPEPSWGNMLAEGRASIDTAWWVSLLPGLCIVFTVLGFNLLGDGLRDALDPRLKQQN
ncbi:MAG: ABC transporter permease [bacterium]